MMSIITPDWPAPASVAAGTTTKLAPQGVLPVELQYLNQVHGAKVVPIEQVRAAHAPIDADAVTGCVSGDHCAVRTADCLPILFCSTDGTRIAAAHGGWRGVLAGVIENTVAELGTDPAELLAWLGPAISQENFEVGEEVREDFVNEDPGAAACFEANARGRWQADLYGLARQRLHRCGVRSIYGGDWCTYRDSRLFYSYRRDKDTARMVSFIHLK